MRAQIKEIALSSTTLVTCSYNRLEALRTTLPNKLAVAGVDSVVVVLDGSSDGSHEWLQQAHHGNARLRVVVLPHGGVQKARRAAIAYVRTPWAVFVDDDDLVPPEFAANLIAEAESQGADFVSAPWLNCTELDVSLAVKNARSLVPKSLPRLGDHPSRWPQAVEWTPFLTGNFCARIEALQAIQHGYTEYPVNGWREESDMFLSMWESGFRGIRSGQSFSWCDQRYAGGQRSGTRLAYERAVIRNEFKFWRTHARLLRELDELRGYWWIPPAQATAARARNLLKAFVRGKTDARRGKK